MPLVAAQAVVPTVWYNCAPSLEPARCAAVVSSPSLSTRNLRRADPHCIARETKSLLLAKGNE